MAHKENFTNVANMTSCYTRKWNNSGEWSGSNLHIGYYGGVRNHRFQIYFTPSVTLTQVKIGIRFTSYNNKYGLGSYYALENVDTGEELQAEKYLGIWNTSTTYYVTFDRTFTAGTEYAVYFGPKWNEYNYYVGTTHSNITITSTVATFTVTYDANGGTTTKTSETGSSMNLPTTTECTRQGYYLLGWSTSSTATEATYQPGAVYAPSADTTLYAVWGLSICHLYLATSSNSYEKHRTWIYSNGGWGLYNPHVYTNGVWVPCESDAEAPNFESPNVSISCETRTQYSGLSLSNPGLVNGDSYYLGYMNGSYYWLQYKFISPTSASSLKFSIKLDRLITDSTSSSSFPWRLKVTDKAIDPDGDTSTTATTIYQAPDRSRYVTWNVTGLNLVQNGTYYLSAWAGSSSYIGGVMTYSYPSYSITLNPSS